MSELVVALVALIASLTGLDRVVDPDLSAIAEQKASEIAACDECFSHDGWRDGTAEVLAWNSGADDPVATAVLGEHGWRNSPAHWAILTDPSLGRIGCGHELVDGRDYFVCVLAAGVGAPERALEGTVPTPAAALPNTSIELSVELVAYVLMAVGVLLVLDSIGRWRRRR